MLVIRLARTGRAKYPTYRIVAAESARAATGRFVEVLGHYNPHTKELVIKREQVEKRLNHGAQPSNSVIKLLQRDGVELPTWVKLKTKTDKKAAAAAEAATAETEVTEAEAAAEADETGEVRVAEVVEEVASDKKPYESLNQEIESPNQATADSEAATAKALDEAQEKAADANTPKAEK